MKGTGNEIPSSIKVLIEKEFASYRIPKQKDIQGVWKDRIDQKRSTYYTSGDFDGNGLEDLAMILLGQKDWKLVAFHQISKGQYKAYPFGTFVGDDQLFTVEHSTQRFYLSTLKKCQKPGTKGKEWSSSTFLYDTILLIENESSPSAQLYRWSSGAYYVIAYTSEGSSFSD